MVAQNVLRLSVCVWVGKHGIVLINEWMHGGLAFVCAR